VKPRMNFFEPPSTFELWWLLQKEIIYHDLPTVFAWIVWNTGELLGFKKVARVAWMASQGREDM